MVSSAGTDISELEKVLSADELERAQKFNFETDRNHYLQRRYQLRVLLSKYCHCAPADLKFGYTRYKKPFIEMPSLNPVKFNLSFAGDVMIIAINLLHDIGVDVEKIHDIPDFEGVSELNFSLQEIRYLNESDDKTDTFFTIWTKKEAFIKANGRGMYYPLKKFSINIRDTAENPSIFNSPMESKAWMVTQVNAPEGYRAALAIKNNIFRIVYMPTE